MRAGGGAAALPCAPIGILTRLTDRSEQSWSFGCGAAKAALEASGEHAQALLQSLMQARTAESISRAVELPFCLLAALLLWRQRSDGCRHWSLQASQCHCASGGSTDFHFHFSDLKSAYPQRNLRYRLTCVVPSCQSAAQGVAQGACSCAGVENAPIKTQQMHAPLNRRGRQKAVAARPLIVNCQSSNDQNRLVLLMSASRGCPINQAGGPTQPRRARPLPLTATAGSPR